MRITIDTKIDTNENIKKAIKMLQSMVGEDALTNIEPESSTHESVFNSIFSDTPQNNIEINQNSSPAISTPVINAKKDEESISDKVLFADLFTEDEIKKMESEKSDDDAEEDKKTSKTTVEFY